MIKPRLTLFDLDHTLLSGDSDVLWCDFLIAQGLLDATSFAAKNADMAARYQAGSVDMQAFADFYVGTLAGRTPLQWEPLRQVFLRDYIAPKLPQEARDLVLRHKAAGDLVVLTTATNRFITELTAALLQIDHLIATEPELVNGVFTGHTTGTLNMRGGKVVRLTQWLANRAASDQAPGAQRGDYFVTAYSDSINDQPLLEMADHAVAVDPDAPLTRLAFENKWDLIKLNR